MESSQGYDYKLHIQPLTYIILRRRPNQTLLFSQNHRFGFYHSDVIGSDDSPINQNDWQLRSWFTVNPPKLCLSVIQLCDDFLWNYSGMWRGRAAAAGQINWEDLLDWFWLCLCVFWIISVLVLINNHSCSPGQHTQKHKVIEIRSIFYPNPNYLTPSPKIAVFVWTEVTSSFMISLFSRPLFIQSQPVTLSSSQSSVSCQTLKCSSFTALISAAWRLCDPSPPQLPRRTFLCTTSSSAPPASRQTSPHGDLLPACI